MCVVLLAHGVHPDFPLVIAANRDEFWDRPTQKLGWWGEPVVLGGRDLTAQGTWMGIDRQGRVACVTNVREGIRKDSKARSRGHLVTEFLQGTLAAEAYAAKVQTQGAEYAAFNLIVGSREGFYFVSNRYPQKALAHGIWGVSNGPLEPPWPKTRFGMERVQRKLREDTAGPDLYWDLLGDRSPASERELPDTGIGLEREKILSPLFVHWPEYKYGTRSSSVLLVSKEGRVEFAEKTHTPQGTATIERVTFVL